MTVRLNSVSETDSRPVAPSQSAQPRSPPRKKLRLSLRGQKILGSTSHSTTTFPARTNPSLAKMQNIRPGMLDPMGLHMSYSSPIGQQSYGRSDLGGESDSYERDRSIRLEPQSCSDKSSHSPPVATLLNLGNTCFLNSVLYTLRFTPGFAHLLHHLASDLNDKKLLSNLGFSNERKIGFLSGSPALRTKSLSSLSPFSGNSEDPNHVPLDATNRKILVLTERLHELLQTLHNAEQKGDLSEPFQADAFLQALREVNPLFQGNQQQDAHELLVCFLDYLREACQLVDKVQSKVAAAAAVAANAQASAAEIAPDSLTDAGKRGKQNGEKKKKGRKIFADRDNKKGKRGAAPLAPSPNPSLMQCQPAAPTPDSAQQQAGANEPCSRDFISDSFEGVTVLRTTCLECEHVTERKESFMDICVPIINENALDDGAPHTPSAFYASALMEVDFLREANKYWCEQCVRYNEARRSVHYEKLPRLLVLQLKRFSLSYGSTVHTSKNNDYMPTPMNLDCFCEHCQASPDVPLHSYKLYAIIMHLGATMASGHYVAYTRVRATASDYITCPRQVTPQVQASKLSAPASNDHSSRSSANSINTGGAAGILRFFKPKSSNSLGIESVNCSDTTSTLCRSVNCCSARPRKLFSDHERERERDYSGRESPASSGSSSGCSLPEDIWLECDDEVIRVLKMRELEDLLCHKSRTHALTPYLLFYVQVNPMAPTGSTK